MTVSSETLRSIRTPDRLDTRLGTLEFVDGVPSSETVTTVYDHLDYVHGLNVFLNGYAGASTYALRKGFHEAGANDNEIVLFSELMGSESLFLTANADTLYFWGIIDLTSGPMVVETPPQALGMFDDMWWQWITDFGLPGPDRGEGGRYLLVPPGYDGALPDSGYHVAHSGTTRVLIFGRSFMVDDDPAPTVEQIKNTLKVYPYDQAGFGTSIATMLEGGRGLLHPPAPIPETVFIEGSGNAFNTIPPNDLGFYELLNELVQENPAGSGDIELMGQLAAIGIVKGEPFEPDERMRRMLEEAAAVGSATSRALLFDPRTSEGFAYYEGSAWQNMLFVGGYSFETPPPLVTTEGIEPFPATGVRALHARTAWFYGITGITPAMCMRLTGLGSQYIMALKDADGAFLDGSRNYRLTLPPDIPAARFWSLTVYDTETRSMLQTPQRFPRVGSQAYPTPAATANDDGTTTITFGPERHADSPDGNWIQTTAGKGWFPILRFYSPTERFFHKRLVDKSWREVFDKSWRPGEIELVTETTTP